MFDHKDGTKPTTTAGRLDYDQFIDSLDLPQSSAEELKQFDPPNSQSNPQLPPLKNWLSIVVHYIFNFCHIERSSKCNPPQSQNPSRRSPSSQCESPSASVDPQIRREPKYQLHSFSKQHPHPLKIETGGEDFFYTDAKHIGLFDGVGGWSAKGVDPRLFASSLQLHLSILCSNLEALVPQEGAPRTDSDLYPEELLRIAFEKTEMQGTEGSSTALIASLHTEEKPMIRYCLVGDTTFVIVRKRAIIFRAGIQQHYFNCPYQLGRLSQKPSEALCGTFVGLEEGDLLIAATDGFWDNIFEFDILNAIAYVLEDEDYRKLNRRKLQELTEFLASSARERSLVKTQPTPFSVAAQEEGYNYQGGKLDDITLVISMFHKDE